MNAVRMRAHLWVLAFFTALTALMLFPLSVRLADHVPDWGDPLEHTWTLAWGARQLLLNPLELYQANIFYPYPNTLAFSESQVATTVVALPILLATGNAILTYNLVFIASFVFSGFACYLLAFDLTRSRWGGVLAGVAFAFCAYKFHHISHLNLVTLQWLPLVFLALRWAFERKAGFAALLFAIAFTGQALSSWYYALMMGLGVALYAGYWVVTRRRLPARQNLVALGACLLPALVLIFALALPYLELNRTLNLTRTLADAQELAARPLSFVSVAAGNMLYGGVLPVGGAETLFVGLVLAGLALAGIVWRARLPDAGFWLILAIFFALLSFGPTFELAPNVNVPSPLFRVLYEWVPGMQGTRAPARFFIMTILALSVFAAQGFRALFESRGQRVRNAAGAALCALMALEYNIAPLGLQPIETGAQVPAVYRWLATQPRGNFIETPLTGSGVTPLTRVMYFSTVHWQPTPLGYGSFSPPTFPDLLAVLGDPVTPPAMRLLNVMREFQVRYWVLHSAAYAPEEWATVQATLEQGSAQLLWEQDGDYVYQVQGAPPDNSLAHSALVPGTATAAAPYTAYVVLDHPRQYPIVNEDTSAHTFAVEWKQGERTLATQLWTMPLPRVIRGRPEGVALTTNAPPAPGQYTLAVSMDGNPLPLRGSDAEVHVSSAAESPAAPLELVEITTNNSHVKPGEALAVTLWWRARTRLADERLVYVGLEDAAGTPRFETTVNPMLSFLHPITHWQPGELVPLEYVVPIPADAAPGEYRLAVELLDPQAVMSFPFRAPDGSTTTHYSNSFQMQ